MQTIFNRRNKLIFFLFCIFLSFTFLLIATKSSPLYPFNDWVDTNASFTMGKAMMNGRVLYRDIVDQRGPFLYLLFGVAYLISNTTFIGVFIFEVVAASFLFYFSFRAINLFINAKYAVISLPMLTAMVLNLKSFAQGGSPEEFCLPLIAVGLYHLLAYFKDIYPKPVPQKWVLINGVIAGCVLWIKFSLLGFWIGWVLSVCISLIINHGMVKALKTCLVFLTGMIIATLPWVAYFGFHQSIYKWVNSYFIVNLRGYSTSSSILTIIKSTIIGILYLLRENPVTIGFLFFGFIVSIIYEKFIEHKLGRVSLLLSFFLLALSVFGGGTLYIYYLLIFSPFIIFGFIFVMTQIFEKYGKIYNSKYAYMLTCIIFIISLTFTYFFHHNVDMLKLTKNDLVQYHYATIINKNENPTLLNYGGLDHGFYTTTGIVPSVKYFQNLNIDYSRYPVVMDEQNRYIREKLVDYVVMQIPISIYDGEIDLPCLNENYQLIETEQQRNEKTDFYYLLFKKK